MPDAKGMIRYLAKLPEYEHVKPYIAAISPNSGVDPSRMPVTNLQWDERTLEFVDIRPSVDEFKIDECGFQVLPHVTAYERVDTIGDVDAYRRETEEVLKEFFKAEVVICYEFKSRKNVDYEQSSLDLEDPLQFLRPARDAHADYTFVSGPITTKRLLQEHHLQQYMRPGYRFRIINTWRSATPEITDLPLALCDFRSIDATDVMASDRIRPDRTGEIFHVQFNQNQRWYFLDSMTNKEPWVFVNYDSMAGDQARFCPHATFHPEGRENGFRESYETRNLVITML